MMGLVLGQSLMVIFTTGVLLYAKVSPLYNVLWECIVVVYTNYIVYKHFDRSLHVGSLDPTCVQNFRPAPFMVFEIQGFNLKNENDKNFFVTYVQRFFKGLAQQMLNQMTCIYMYIQKIMEQV